MKHVNFKEVELEEVNMEGAVGANIRWLISQKDGAPNFAMRMFEIAINGNTPYHTHNYEHEVFVLSGQGKTVTAEGEKVMNTWDVIFIPPNIDHQFVNTSDIPLVFLCLIPNEVKKVSSKNPFASGKANTC